LQNLAFGGHGVSESFGALADAHDPRLATARTGLDGSLELGGRR
jgi:hypothetical protein